MPSAFGLSMRTIASSIPPYTKNESCEAQALMRRRLRSGGEYHTGGELAVVCSLSVPPYFSHRYTTTLQAISAHRSKIMLATRYYPPLQPKTTTTSSLTNTSSTSPITISVISFTSYFTSTTHPSPHKPLNIFNLFQYVIPYNNYLISFSRKATWLLAKSLNAYPPTSCLVAPKGQRRVSPGQFLFDLMKHPITRHTRPPMLCAKHEDGGRNSRVKLVYFQTTH